MRRTHLKDKNRRMISTKCFKLISTKREGKKIALKLRNLDIFKNILSFDMSASAHGNSREPKTKSKNKR